MDHHAKIVIRRNARLATLAGADWGLIERGAIVSQGDSIIWLGAEQDLAANQLPNGINSNDIEEHDLQGALLMPGLVDCHTHLVYGGQRANEAEMRLNGASYEAIARAGGGIRSTVAATRAADESELLRTALQRAKALMAHGATTLEVKSGYGLSLEDEARSLRVARQLAKVLPITIKTSFLGAHALPPEYEGRQDAYIDAVCLWMGELHAQGLIDAVDAFCENVAFSIAQTQRVFAKAQALGLPVKLHAEQLSDQGGAQLAASFHALSCDHLEYLSDTGIAAMKQAGTVAVLLPGAFYMLRETKLPPIAGLRTAGVPIAISTDHNPGTSAALSLPLMAHMACTFFRLTPLEAVQGITRNAALALGLRDRGQLAVGMRADYSVWELDHPNELTYWFGGNPCKHIVIGGKVVP